MSDLNPFFQFPVVDEGSGSGRQIVSQDTAVKPSMDSWSSPALGVLFLIQDVPEFNLLIDDVNLLLIQ
jgi:hypothetical protein